MSEFDDNIDKLFNDMEFNSTILKERTLIEERASELIGKCMFDEAIQILKTCPDFDKRR